MTRLTLPATTAILLVVFTSPLTSGNGHAADRPQPLVVFAAASLKTALDDIALRWQHDTGRIVRVSYAGTSALARQIEQGAPADVFLSADRDWMDYLSSRGLVRDPVALLGNRLVLVAPRDSAASVDLKQGGSIMVALGDGRLSVANVQSVPAGRYARAALESLGLWRELEGRLVQSADVRAALRLVARGEMPLGIVYATDARAEPLVRVVATFDESAHPPIVYMAATVTESTRSQALDFVASLSAAPARGILEREGFTVLAGAPE